MKSHEILLNTFRACTHFKMPVSMEVDNKTYDYFANEDVRLVKHRVRDHIWELEKYVPGDAL